MYNLVKSVLAMNNATQEQIQQSRMLQQILSILKRPSETRKDNEIKQLIPYLKQIKFFQERQEIMKESDFLFLCERATYEHYNPHRVIFNYGDYGEKFYIILEGQVSVLLPRKRERTSQNENDSHEANQNFDQPQLPNSPLRSPAKTNVIDRLRNATSRLIQDVKQSNSFFVEVGQIKSGQGFGELALISNKLRSATIKASLDTHLLVLQRKDFEKVLQRQEEANIQKTVDFLKNMPQFKNWTKNSLSKLSYFFQKKQYSRSHTVYKEGETCANVYIVFEGEFEIIKKKFEYDMIQQNKNYNQYLGPQQNLQEYNDENEESPQKRTASFSLPRQDQNYTQKILLLGRGDMIGEEDAINQRDYTCTVKCNSLNGTLLAIKIQDFYQRIKTNQDTWKQIQNKGTQKEFTTINSINKQYTLDKETKEQCKDLVRQKLQDIEIQDIDFFKTMFWGEPIPPRKIDKIIELNQNMREASKIKRDYQNYTKKPNFIQSFMKKLRAVEVISQDFFKKQYCEQLTQNYNQSFSIK
eukprot:403364882